MKQNRNGEKEVYYLAVDIGASGGRHILGSVIDGKIVTEEVYRFPNGAVKKDGRLIWESDRLFEEIKNGMKKCKEIEKIPVSMGIDCFGVDFALLDKEGNLIGDTVSYRDSRTEGMADSGRIDKKWLYNVTGKPTGDIHSLYQLMCIKETSDELEKAERFLHLPDYFHYLLTGVAANEYTNSETSLLINPHTKDFDPEILDKAGIPAHIFEKPLMPMSILGNLKEDIQKEVGFDCQVVLPATHDTISAFMTVDAKEENLFISSGTWSMMGTFIKEPLFLEEGREKGLSNMYIQDGVTAYVKGITGLWMIQSVKKELDNKYDWEEMYQMAKASSYTEAIDVDDNCFMAPESMIEAVKEHLKKKTGKAPDNIDGVLNAIYNGLARKYAQTATELEKITGKSCSHIQIVGGGSKNLYLNELTEQYSGKKVYKGAAEATAIGNLLAQMVAMKEFANLEEAKKTVEA